MASRGLNKVTLLGHLGADPEKRRTQSGVIVTNLRLATTESWYNSETQESNERTEWHRVVFFGRQAETIAQYARKGSQIYIEGRLQTRKWEDRNTGQDRYSTEVIGREFIFTGGRPEGGESFANEGRITDTSSDSFGTTESSPADTNDAGSDDSFDDIPW